jgi:hypothetical protein
MQPDLRGMAAVFGDELYSPICPDLPYPKDCGKKAKAQ